VDKRLADVAAFAGVSVATVRRALLDQPGVAPKTKAAVLAALDVLGLERPSRSPASKGGLVGLVVPDLQNPIFPALVEAVSIGLVRRGLMTALCTRTADGVSEANYVELLLRREIAGMVFIGASYADAGPEHGKELRQRAIPLVLINAADENEGVPRVSVDDEAAAERALGHLASLGHERIGLILGPEGHVPSARKLGAYVRHVRASPGDQSWRELVLHVPFSVEGGGAAITRLLARGVTGVVCASDALALGAIHTARRRGLAVPGDLSVTGFDDGPYMPLVEVPLTTIRQPVRALGTAAVKLLEAQINGLSAAGEELLLEPELIVRGSTGPCRTLDWSSFFASMQNSDIK
jgi:DNA-binding LacI/PurR family transcriptional regulator